MNSVKERSTDFFSTHPVFTHEEFFTLHNVEKDFPPIFDRFFADEKKRTCKKCGTVMPRPPAPGA